jgi:hypothetical protein
MIHSIHSFIHSFAGPEQHPTPIAAIVWHGFLQIWCGAGTESRAMDVDTTGRSGSLLSGDWFSDVFSIMM